MSGEHVEALGTEEFGAFVDGLDYPMYVVTVASGGERSGCLVGFTTQVGIAPPRFLVCLSARNHTYSLATGARSLAVHLLGPEQHGLARLFGEETGDELDKFAECRWRPGPEEVPILEDCARYFVGRVVAQVAFGDHIGFVLEPTEMGAGDAGAVLTFSDVKDMTPGHGA
ncbi:MAG TPA: flavin reductase family protein [Intrasporangium sp.]|nr:flavin reductase family protein [Intrasporangium sp.]